VVTRKGRLLRAGLAVLALGAGMVTPLLAAPVAASADYFGSVVGTRPASPPFIVSPDSYDISGGPVTIVFTIQVHNRSKTPIAVPVDFNVHHILTYFGQNVADGQPGKAGISFHKGDSAGTTQATYGTPTLTAITVEPKGSPWQTLSFSQVISDCGYYQFDAGYHHGGTHSNLSTGFTRVLGCQAASGSVTPTITDFLTDRAGGPLQSRSSDWFRKPVVVNFACSDPVFPVTACGPNRTLTEGASQFVEGTVMDSAGNTNTDTVGPINVDLTDPTISAATSSLPNGLGWFRAPVTVSFTCADALSGVVACPSPVDVAA